MLTLNSEGIKIKGYRGTWHVIEIAHFPKEWKFKYPDLYLLEHDFYGDETASLIVGENKETHDFEIVLDDVWNGFDDYLELHAVPDEEAITFES